jgi:hypothetical protein
MLTVCRRCSCTGTAPRSWGTHTQHFPAPRSLGAGMKLPFWLGAWELFGSFLGTCFGCSLFWGACRSSCLFRSFQKLLDGEGAFASSWPCGAQNHKKCAKNQLNDRCFSCQEITNNKKSIESINHAILKIFKVI